MKKYIYAILAILFTGCSQDMTEDVKVKVQEKVVRATTTDDSRTYFEQDNDVYNHKWAQDDEIGVFDKTTAISEYLLIDGVDTKNGTFLQISMPDDGKTLNNSYAIYPYSESYKMTAEGVFNITFPAEQTYDSQHPNSYGKGANILVGMGANDNFAFKNVCGFLEIQLKGSATISEIRLRGNNNERIAGAGIVSYKGDAEPKTTMLSAATNEIVLNIGSGVALDAQNAKSFIIALPPTTFTKGFTVTTSAAEFSTERNIVISRNKITPMSVVEVEEVIPEVPETWKIYYTATGKIELSCDKEDFGANIIANKFDAATGSGVVVFDAPVTYFGSPFAYNDTLTSIVIPDSVTEFDWYAFDNCYNLTSVNIPNGVTTLPEGLFEYCDKLASITIPDSVTTVEDCVFMSCIGITDITFGKKVTSVGANVFYGCEALSRVEFLSTTPPTLSESAFYINPDSTKNPKIYVPDEAFVAYCSCNWREEYKSWIVGNEPLAPNEITYTTIDGNIITPNTENFSVTLLSNTYENGKGRMIFDGELSSIGGYAFSNCASLKSMRIPDSVSAIGSNAFYNCTSLVSITIPDSVSAIESNTFSNCTSLASITMPDSVTSIGNQAFQNCTSLASITIPNSVTSIGNYAFQKCTSLTSVTIGNGVISIGKYTFYDCTSLASITIPNSVTSIGNYAFQKCTSLTSVSLPDNITSIGEGTFSNCTSLISVSIPNKVTSIGSNAFSNCTSLASITIPNSVTSIKGRAFSSCSSLTSVVIGNGVTKINEFTFEFCESLSEVTLGANIAYIYRAAFYRCSNLKTIYCKPSSPPAIYVESGSYSAIPFNSGLTIYVPRSSYSTYTGMVNWDNGGTREWNWYKYEDYIYPYNF